MIRYLSDEDRVVDLVPGAVVYVIQPGSTYIRAFRIVKVSGTETDPVFECEFVKDESMKYSFTYADVGVDVFYDDATAMRELCISI